MDIRQYLDATYLKTPQQASLTYAENEQVVQGLVVEAIQQNYKLVMVRPNMVAMCRRMIDKADTNVLVGTVIDFPEGNRGLSAKLTEAQHAIDNGADDLDFVIDYNAFINGNFDVVKNEVLQCTALGLQNNKTVKWIVEIAALTNEQIAGLTLLIKQVVLQAFDKVNYSRVFVKSSTGFYVTHNGRPNGATIEGLKLMLDNAGPLPVKAAGGVKDYNQAVAMINMGVMRIGTSSAKEIVSGRQATGGY